MRQIVFFIVMLMTLALSSCTASREAVVQQLSQQREQIVHDSVIIERHRVDSVFRRDSIYVSQLTHNDTVYLEKHHYHYVYVREQETKSDSAVTTEKEETAKEEVKETEIVKEKKKVWPYFAMVSLLIGCAATILIARKEWQ